MDLDEEIDTTPMELAWPPNSDNKTQESYLAWTRNSPTNNILICNFYTLVFVQIKQMRYNISISDP